MEYVNRFKLSTSPNNKKMLSIVLNMSFPLNNKVTPTFDKGLLCHLLDKRPAYTIQSAK